MELHRNKKGLTAMDREHTIMKYRILIADASEENRSILSAMLGEQYEISVAENGTEAAGLLKGDGGGIDLMLLNLMLPETGGLGVLEWMNRQNLIGTVPAVMIGKAYDPVCMEKAFELGAADYICMPFHAAIVRRRVANTMTLYAGQKKPAHMAENRKLSDGPDPYIRDCRPGAEKDTREEHKRIAELMRALKKVFDIVRLVDVAESYQIKPSDNGMDIITLHHCYAIWNRGQRCENCVSVKAYVKRSQMVKIEFCDTDIYLVIARYVEIGGTGYVLEMISRVNDRLLLGAYGINELIDKIIRHNKELYIDSLTGAFNRRYYEDQLKGLTRLEAVAMIDIDNFKQINDTCGHFAGDRALAEIVETIHTCILRVRDVLIRFGGDEFLLVFSEISAEEFEEVLERIRAAVSECSLEGCPQIRLSVSIGGVHSVYPAVKAIRLADELMYRAKATKNTVLTFHGNEQ